MIRVKPKTRKFVTGGLSDSIYYTPVQTFLPRASEHLDASLFQAPVQKEIPLPEREKDLFKGEAYNNERAVAINQYNALFDQIEAFDPSDIRYGNRAMKLAFHRAQTLGQKLAGDLKQSRDQNDKVQSAIQTNKAEGEKFVVGKHTVVRDLKTGELKGVTLYQARTNPDYQMLSLGEYVDQRKNNPLMAFDNRFAGDATKITGYDSDVDMVNKLMNGLGETTTNDISRITQPMSSAALGNFYAKVTRGEKLTTNEAQLSNLITNSFQNLPENIKNTLYGRAYSQVDHKGKTEEEFHNAVEIQAALNMAGLLNTKLKVSRETPQDAGIDADANSNPTAQTNPFIDALVYSKGIYEPMQMQAAGLTGTGGIGEYARGFRVPLNNFQPNTPAGVPKMGLNNEYIANIAAYGTTATGKRLEDFGDAMKTAIIPKNGVVVANNLYTYSKDTGQYVPAFASEPRELIRINEAFQKAAKKYNTDHPDATVKEQQDFMRAFYGRQVDNDGNKSPIVVIPTVHSEVIMAVTDKDLAESEKITPHTKTGYASMKEAILDYDTSIKTFKVLNKNDPEWRAYATAYYDAHVKQTSTTSAQDGDKLSNAKLEEYLEGKKIVKTTIMNPVDKNSPAINILSPFVKPGLTNIPKSDLSNQKETLGQPYKEGGLIPNQVTKFQLNIKSILLSDLY